MKTIDEHDLVKGQRYYLSDYDKVIPIVVVCWTHSHIRIRENLSGNFCMSQILDIWQCRIYKDYGKAQDDVDKWIEDNKNEME